MAYAIVYGIHTLEMSALRGWGVAFLGFVAASTGATASLVSPATALTILGLAGTVASILGNEAAIRLGHRPANRSRAPGFNRLRRPAGPFRLHVLRLGGCVAPSLRTHHLAQLVVAHRRHRRHRGAVASRCNARRPFHARLHRRLHRSARRRVDSRPRRWNGAHNVGSGFSCRRTAFGRRPRRVYPHAAARALRRPWIGMTAKSRRFASGTRDSRRPLQRTARYVS